MPQDSLTVELTKRDELGKKVKHLRAQGYVPAVVHDHGKPSLHVKGSTNELLKLWRQAGKHHPISIKAEDKDFVALIKDIKFGPKKHDLQHIVFNAVDRDQKVEANIPLKAKYAEDNESSPAERSGLIVLTQLETVEVRALANKLPDLIEYDGEKLVDVGDHIAAKDLIIPEGVELLTEPEHAVATVYEPSALAAANDAAGGTEEPEEAEEPTEEGEETTEQSDTKAEDTSSTQEKSEESKD